MAMNKVNQRKEKGERIITLIIEKDNYQGFIEDSKKARLVIDAQFSKHSQLFPVKIRDGYTLNGTTSLSSKTGLRKRLIIIGEEYYQLHPCFLLPDMRGEITEEIEKGMYLRSIGVPLHAITYCFGYNDSFWYCLEQHLGKKSIVGTSIYGKDTEIPEDITVDEKHVIINKEKHYIATTVGDECILGAEISATADTDGLIQAYDVFKEESRAKQEEYSPKTVNTDGWGATINAMTALFPSAVLIRCFLHAFLKIRTASTKKMEEVFSQVSTIIWECYRAENKRSFSQRIRRLREWTLTHIQQEKLLSPILKLCERYQEFTPYFDRKTTHRTSNMLDRLMKFMDRKIFIAQGFHGSKLAGNRSIRAFVLLRNFAPSNPKSQKNGLKSPAERLNGFSFSDNWVENLMISSSLNGKR